MPPSRIRIRRFKPPPRRDLLAHSACAGPVTGRPGDAVADAQKTVLGERGISWDFVGGQTKAGVKMAENRGLQQTKALRHL